MVSATWRREYSSILVASEYTWIGSPLRRVLSQFLISRDRRAFERRIHSIKFLILREPMLLTAMQYVTEFFYLLMINFTSNHLFFFCTRGGWIDSKESNNEVLELLSNSQNKKKIKFGLGPSLTHNKQLKDSPSASSGLEDPTVPSDQTPVLIEGLWKGGEPHSLNPGGPEIPAKSVSANSSQILVNSVRLNDSESCEDPESFENSKSSEYFENRVKAWLLESADIKVNQILESIMTLKFCSIQNIRYQIMFKN